MLKYCFMLFCVEKLALELGNFCPMSSKLPDFVEKRSIAEWKKNRLLVSFNHPKLLRYTLISRCITLLYNFPYLMTFKLVGYG